jgi:hypothetical protein
MGNNFRNDFVSILQCSITPALHSEIVRVAGACARPPSHLHYRRFERRASALGYTGWYPRPDLHRHCARFKCAVSALDYVGEMVPREGFPPPTSPF